MYAKKDQDSRGKGYLKFTHISLRKTIRVLLLVLYTEKITVSLLLYIYLHCIAKN